MEDEGDARHTGGVLRHATERDGHDDAGLEAQRKNRNLGRFTMPRMETAVLFFLPTFYDGIGSSTL